LKDILLNGASFPLEQISSIERKQDLVFHQERGNRKSATNNHPILNKMISEDVERGFALPLPTAILHMIPKASLAPLGCQMQESINEFGERITKTKNDS
jgi:hypothetical protein